MCETFSQEDQGKPMNSKAKFLKAKFHLFKIYLVLWSFSGCLSHWGPEKGGGYGKAPHPFLASSAAPCHGQ